MGPASKKIYIYPNTFSFFLHPRLPTSLWLCLLFTPLHLGEAEAWTVLGPFPQSSLLYVFCVGFLWCNRKWLLAVCLRQSATQRGRTCCHSGLFTGKLLHGLVAMAMRPGSRGVTSVWNHAFQLHCLIVQVSRGPWDVSPAEEPNGQLPPQHSELQLIEEQQNNWIMCLYEKQER